MMTEVVISGKFKRAFRKFVRRNQLLQIRVEQAIEDLAHDIYHPSLGTHKLEGKLSGLLSCSCGYDCRIVFAIEKDDRSGEIAIVSLDVGTHDEIY